jgi:photosystem II stability/assembly factor-like uncharacterized protein
VKDVFFLHCLSDKKHFLIGLIVEQSKTSHEAQTGALALAVILCFLVANPNAICEQSSNSGWHPSKTQFRGLAIASDGSSIWACGTDEGIAVSGDGGTHWKVKHQTPDGNLLLNIQFVSSKFGYAAGTGGLILTTEDRGKPGFLIPP